LFLLLFLLLGYSCRDSPFAVRTALVQHQPLAQAPNVEEMAALDVLDLFFMLKISEAYRTSVDIATIELILFIRNSTDFRFSHASPSIFPRIGQLLDASADLGEIYEHDMKSLSIERHDIMQH
jgi:hypothetical protein